MKALQSLQFPGSEVVVDRATCAVIDAAAHTLLPGPVQPGSDGLWIHSRGQEPERVDEGEAGPIVPQLAQIEHIALTGIGIQSVVSDQQDQVEVQVVGLQGRGYGLEGAIRRSQPPAQQDLEQGGCCGAARVQAHGAERESWPAEGPDAANGTPGCDPQTPQHRIAGVAEGLDGGEQAGVQLTAPEGSDQPGRRIHHQPDRWIFVQTCQERRSHAERNSSKPYAQMDRPMPFVWGGQYTRARMQKNDSRTKRWRWALLALVVLVFPAYQGVLWGVRAYVDSRIGRMEGQALPQFSMTGRDGVVYSTESLRGRTVVLNFFRSRCINCRLEKEAIKALAREVDEEKVLVLGVMTDAALSIPPEDSERTLEFMGYEHPVIMADREFMDAFHGVTWSNVTPVTYIVDPNGANVRSMRGERSLFEFRVALEGLD